MLALGRSFRQAICKTAMTTIIPAFLILTTENTENSWCPAMDFQFQFGHPSVTELSTPDGNSKLSPGLAAGMVASIESTPCPGGISVREVKPSPGVLSQPMDPTESGAHSVTVDQLRRYSAAKPDTQAAAGMQPAKRARLAGLRKQRCA